MIKIKSTLEEIEKAISSLPVNQRLQVLKRLEDNLFPQRFRQIVKTMRAKGVPPSSEDIRQAVKQARTQIHERKTQSRH